MTTTKKIAFTVDGQEFSLLMNFAALCAVEEELDQSFPYIIASLQGGNVRLSTIVTMFRAALLNERPGITRAEAMALIEEVGPEHAAKLISEAIEESPMFKGGAGKKIAAKRKAA